MSSAVVTSAEYDVKALEKLKDLYGDLAQIPNPSQGRIDKKPGDEIIKVSGNRRDHAESNELSIKIDFFCICPKIPHFSPFSTKSRPKR